MPVSDADSGHFGFESEQNLAVLTDFRKNVLDGNSQVLHISLENNISQYNQLLEVSRLSQLLFNRRGTPVIYMCVSMMNLDTV